MSISKVVISDVFGNTLIEVFGARNGCCGSGIEPLALYAEDSLGAHPRLILYSARLLVSEISLVGSKAAAVEAVLDAAALDPVVEYRHYHRQHLRGVSKRG